MGENTKIEWATHTFNPWTGCAKVSPGCDNCYAENWAKRSGQVKWGQGNPRKITSAQNWEKPLKWDREAQKTGIIPRVFCASLADIFDNEVPDAWRDRLWDLIRTTKNLYWIIVTKRIGNADQMLPLDWGDGWPHVQLTVTITNQLEADRDIQKLIDTPAAYRGLSMEPLLGSVNLYRAQSNWWLWVDSVIVGGESGPNARPMHPEWARSLRDQCTKWMVPFFFKQWGEWMPATDAHEMGIIAKLSDPWGLLQPLMARPGKQRAGRKLDGREWNELYPKDATNICLWLGKQRDGSWLNLGVITFAEASAKMDELDLVEICNEEGLITAT